MKTLLLPIALLLASCSAGDNEAGQSVSDSIFLEEFEEAIAVLEQPGRAVYHDEYGNALIHSAVQSLDRDVVAAVLADGHDVDEENEEGHNALDIAAALVVAGQGSSALPIAQLLAEHGAESETWDELLATQARISKEIQDEIDRSLDPEVIQREAWERIHGR